MPEFALALRFHVTIDDKGNIVQKVVVQSLNPAIDGKVLEALENWRLFESLRVAGVRRAQEAGITTAAQRRQAVRRALNRTRQRQR